VEFLAPKYRTRPHARKIRHRQLSPLPIWSTADRIGWRLAMSVGARLAGWTRLATLVLLVAAPGCSIGPKALQRTRLPYNEAMLC